MTDLDSPSFPAAPPSPPSPPSPAAVASPSPPAVVPAPAAVVVAAVVHDAAHVSKPVALDAVFLVKSGHLHSVDASATHVGSAAALYP